LCDASYLNIIFLFKKNIVINEYLINDLNKNQYNDLIELNIRELSDILNLLKIEINSDNYNILYSNILETIYLASLIASNYLSQNNPRKNRMYP
jgi:hypothetical protein